MGWSERHPVLAFDVACTAGLGGFAPVVDGGDGRARAPATSSPFVLSITKPDGNAAIHGLTMALPTGLLAKLKGKLGTQVGTVKAFAGSGSNPFMLPGRVFLEGAYGDAPFALRVEVPAKAGPFDLGTVTVRQKIYVDPITRTSRWSAIPCRRSSPASRCGCNASRSTSTRPDFIVNPTSCEAKTIGGTLGSVDGKSAPINVRFQAADCGSRWISSRASGCR